MDIAELISRAEIQEVLTRYARSVDRQDFALARSCYHDDAFDDHGRYKGDINGLITYFSELGAQLESTYHMMGAPNIQVSGDRAWCETYAFYRRHIKGSKPVLQGLRYLDYMERRDGQWRVARRLIVLDWEHEAGKPADPPADAAWLRGGYGSSDPTAAFFAEARGCVGHPV